MSALTSCHRRRLPPSVGTMAHPSRVLRSINNEGADRCVDIFQRPDGTIGFEEHRRDVEDGRGWFAIGHYSTHTFEDENAALEAAIARVPWLRNTLRPT
jgi:hypothetical protein